MALMQTTPPTPSQRWAPIAYDGAPTLLKTSLFLVLCAAWLLPGLVGHDPWKGDEAVVFGAIRGVLETGDWLTFSIVGEPIHDRAPLYLWVGAGLAKLLGSVMPTHDAARLATGVFMAIAMAATTFASRELGGERAVRMAVLLFIGCLGLLIRAHQMNTDVAGLCGAAIGLHGLALALRRPVLGGVATGIGLGVAFLGDGLLPMAMLLAAMALLPVASPAWRSREHAITVGVALAVAAPLVAAWPLALQATAPHYLALWWQNTTASRWSESAADGIAGLGYFLRILPWYAWPAWPLAAWTLWRTRRTLAARRNLMLPTVAFVAFFAIVTLFGEAREVNAMPLLIPLAMLGVAEIESLPRGAASALDWFGMTTFFLLAALVWLAWIAAMTGEPQFARAWLQREVPDFTYPFSFLAVSMASLLTLIWLVVVARSLRSTRRALVNWTAGITMVWVLVMTLGAPLVDQARSYRTLATRIVEQLPPAWGCVAQRNVGEAQRALFDYFVNLRMVREEMPASSHCNVLLVQAVPGRIPDPGPDWTSAWQGTRPGDRTEVFALYRRVGDVRSSRSSTQWRTDRVAPDARWLRHPMFAVAMTSGEPPSSAASLSASRRADISGWSSE
jgi:4-amino-4-deoxy-L-arabinose transferase-like glycosyltransferase